MKGHASKLWRITWGKLFAGNGSPSILTVDFLDFMADMGAGLGDGVRNSLKDRFRYGMYQQTQGRTKSNCFP